MQVLDEEQVSVVLTLDEFDSVIENEGSDAVSRVDQAAGDAAGQTAAALIHFYHARPKSGGEAGRE